MYYVKNKMFMYVYAAFQCGPLRFNPNKQWPCPMSNPTQPNQMICDKEREKKEKKPLRLTLPTADPNLMLND